MKLLALTLLASLSLAGCLGVDDGVDDDESANDQNAQQAPVQTGPTVIAGTDAMSERVGPALSANRGEAASWELTYPAVLLSLQVQVSWENGTNRFNLDVDGPAGDTQTFSSGTDIGVKSLEGVVGDLTGGRYKFTVHMMGVRAPDTITLEVQYKRVQEGTADVVQGATELPVKTYQEGGKWLATIAYAATGAVGDHAEADVQGANGVIHVGEATGTTAVLNMVAWARADSESEAVEVVRDIEVHLRIADDHIEGSSPNEQWNNRGLHVSVYVPEGTTLGGSVDSSNGPVEVASVVLDGLDLSSSNGGMEFRDVHATDLSGSTSNGPITGEVRAAGSLTFDTSNGGIDLTVRPADDLELYVGTSNGEIDLALEERSDVAYDLALDTSNGRIEEDMDDAEYSGDRNGGELRTRDGDDRDVHVEGTVETSNGSISIAGA